MLRRRSVPSPLIGYRHGGPKLVDVGGPDGSSFGVALSPEIRRAAVVDSLGREASGREKDDGAVLWLRP